MTLSVPDISGLLSWEDGLPHPNWDLVSSWVEAHCSAANQREAWVAIAVQWLRKLGPALGGGYQVGETDHFVGLAPAAGDVVGPILLFGERVRTALLGILAGVANFDVAGKQIVVALRDQDAYYRYIAPFYGEGTHGGSVGVHIRQGYPHVALRGPNLDLLQNTLAHELTHVSLLHLALPQWVEEGLAQMVEHDMTGRAFLMVDGEMARRHKQYWGRHGLDAFWRGEGFLQPGQVQELSYQLAEILVRLLVEDAQPRWFGWVRGQQQQFFTFLREARADDCGATASRKHLARSLGELAARFLGPGEWDPEL
jgi:hypothetical protein